MISDKELQALNKEDFIELKRTIDLEDRRRFEEEEKKKEETSNSYVGKYYKHKEYGQVIKLLRPCPGNNFKFDCLCVVPKEDIDVSKALCAFVDESGIISFTTEDFLCYKFKGSHVDYSLGMEDWEEITKEEFDKVLSDALEAVKEI